VLVTKLGTVYHAFRIERVDPAGLTISYVPKGGGLGMEKIPFNLFPDDWQRHYGYDPKKAAKFDLEQKQAMALMREQMIADEQAYRDKRAQEEAAEEAAAAQAKIDAEAAQKTTEAAATQTTNSPAITDTNQPAPPLPGGY
jgi:sRNA-binding protein